MRRLLLAICAFGLGMLLVNPAVAHAQEDASPGHISEEPLLDAEGQPFVALELETAIGVQSAISEQIPVYVYVTPHIDASKAQLKWDVPQGLSAQSPVEQWFSLESGAGQQFSLMVLPQSAGSFKIGVEVVAWRYDSNYVNSAEIGLTIDDNLRSTPIPAEYTRNVILLTVAKWLAVVLVVLGLLAMYKFILKKYIKWPQRKSRNPSPPPQNPNAEGSHGRA